MSKFYLKRLMNLQTIKSNTLPECVKSQYIRYLKSFYIKIGLKRRKKGSVNARIL